MGTEKTENLLNNLGGRKFIFGIVLAVGILVMGSLGKVTFEQVISAWEWVFATFVVGNAGTKIADSILKK